MDYLELPPAPGLRSRIRCYWFLTGTAATIPAPALPDGSPELVLNLGEGVDAPAANGQRTTQPRATFVGQITGPFLVAPRGTLDLVGVRFEAHGPAGTVDQLDWLRDRWIDAGLIRALGTDRLLAELAGAPSATLRAAVLDRHFGSRWPDPRAGSNRAVDRAIAMIRRTGGSVSLEGVMAAVGITARQLQRAFASDVGLSPKLFVRICRFQRVFAAWQESPGSWARTAIECGYYDQSHLVRDFREFAGGAPARFVESGPEFSRLFTALGPGRSDQIF